MTGSESGFDRSDFFEEWSDFFEDFSDFFDDLSDLLEDFSDFFGEPSDFTEDFLELRVDSPIERTNESDLTDPEGDLSRSRRRWLGEVGSVRRFDSSNDFTRFNLGSGSDASSSSETALSSVRDDPIFVDDPEIARTKERVRNAPILPRLPKASLFSAVRFLPLVFRGSSSG